MRKILCLILIVSSFTLPLTGCKWPSDFSYLKDTSEISAIEVVEFSNDWNDYTKSTKTITNITDVVGFISGLSAVPYYSSFHDPRCMDHKCLAFKISYADGSYEIFNNRAKYVYISETEYFSDCAMASTFNSKEFDEFLYSHLPSERAVYTYMHPTEEIATVELGKRTYTDGEDGFDVTKKIEDIEDFIRHHQSLDYTYNPAGNETKNVVVKNGEYAFKITYSNGDYELFSALGREEYYQSSCWHVNIGRFNESEFQGFIDKYRAAE